MPDSIETANLDSQIEALIRKATNCLRQQSDDLRRATERAREPNADEAVNEAPSHR